MSLGPTAIYGWLAKPGAPDELAGAAFLLSPQLAVTCAHVVRDHLGLGEATPAHAPQQSVQLRFPALELEARATVIVEGWYAGGPRGGAKALRDIAFLELAEPLPVEDLCCVALAANMPAGGSEGRIFGAEPKWQEHGQEVAVQLGSSTNLRGQWQLTPVRGHGFAVERGFSGAPLFGESMTTIWGMVQQVDPNGRKEAFAIGADRLQEALKRLGYGLAKTVQTAGRLQEEAEAAMAQLRETYAAREREWAERDARREAEMRDMVIALTRQATQTPGDDTAEVALRGLAQRDTAAAERLLEERVAAGAAAIRRAAEAARWLGILRLPTDAAQALESLREAHRLDPDDLQTLWSLAEAEQQAGTLLRARSAVERALGLLPEAATEDRAAWLTVAGDVASDAGDLAAARDAYQKGLDIAEALARADPSNAGWQRDLSVSLNKLGDVARDAGDLAAARDAYQRGLDIARRLQTTDPTNIWLMQSRALLAARLAKMPDQPSDLLLEEARGQARKALSLPDLGAGLRESFEWVLKDTGD
jgi:tetratricopeptide (TPR) repeat protein